MFKDIYLISKNMLISFIVETCNGSKKGVSKYGVSIIKLAKILYDISGVLGTLFSKNISFVNSGTSQFSSKLPNGGW